MEVLTSIDQMKELSSSVITVGNYDGIHKGSSMLNLRSTPTLKFFYDDSFEQFEKIDKLIKEID
jgi:FAD synthase